MKFLLALIALVGAVAAQQANDGRVLAETLEKRGEALISQTRTTLEEMRRNGEFQFAGALEHQITIVEALVMDLRVQLSDTTKQFNPHHVHVIEEDLFHLENSIVDEIYAINQARANLPPVNPNQSVSDLVNKAENLIRQAQEALGHHKDTPEAAGIQREIAALQQLIKLLSAKPANPTDLRTDEEQLVRHERSLQLLLEKAANRNTGPAPTDP